MVNVYITNYTDNTISVIDTSTDNITATITAGGGPRQVAVMPDASKVYVCNYGGNNVSVINTSSNTIVATITVNNAQGVIAITPDGKTAYTISSNIPLPGVLSVIDTATNTVTATLSTSAAFGLAITHDGSELFLANGDIFNTSSQTVTGMLPLGGLSMAITPNGNEIYETTGASSVAYVVNTNSNVITATITFGGNPSWAAVTPDGTEVYIPALVGSGGAVFVIDTTTKTVTHTITVGNQPIGCSITPDGSKAYVPNYMSNTVSVIDIATHTVSKTINVGRGPQTYGQFIQPAMLPNPVIYISNWFGC